MPDKADMSLDEIIKSNKPRGGRGGRGGRMLSRGGGSRPFGTRRGRGGFRGGFGGSGGIMKRRSGGPGGLKTSPFKSAARVPDGKWLHDMYSGARSSGLRTGGGLSIGPTKIIISNLDFGVNDKDIKDLFEEFGTIRKASVHYDRTGRSLGTADVLFDKRQFAIQAVKKYNGVQLDGRPMTIQLASDAQSPPQQQYQGGAGNGAGNGQMGRNGSVASMQRRGGRRGGRMGGRGGGRQGAKQAKSAAELDAELDSYTKMQTE